MLTTFQVFLRIVVVLNLFSSQTLWATSEEAPEAPDSIPGATKVDAEDVINTISQFENLIVIDARVAMDRKQGYIEDSISLPDTETDCAALSMAAPASDHPLLFYCNGPKCGRSVKSIIVAQACGYTKLYWFRGGFEEWTKKNYPILKE